jgi:hypothetical protein
MTRAPQVGLFLALAACAGCASIKFRPLHTYTAGYSRGTVAGENVLPTDRNLPDDLPGAERFSAEVSSESRTLDPDNGRTVVHWRTLSDVELTGSPDGFRIASVGARTAAPDAGPWDRAYDTALAAYKDPANPLESIEPDFEEEQKLGDDPAPPEAPPAAHAQKAALGVEESPMWPSGGGICWSRGSQYSQLEDARNEVLQHPEWHPEQIRIAHLDTGYAAEDPLLPPSLVVWESKSFYPDAHSAEGGVGHGNSTLSTLAGGQVEVAGGVDGGTLYLGVLGANPDADVREYQISRTGLSLSGGVTWGPVHLGPARMANAIVEAANNHVDVISLSAGGMPSVAQAQAVDYAYNHGTAIFAATGDFLDFVLFTTPSEVVYPANYTQVIGVAGVTAENRAYGDSPCYLCLWRFWKWLDWAFRGSYGPAESMVHAVSGFSPNVSRSGGGGRIDRDGGGTSHATPQVAGAAAYWLARHRSEISAEKWNTWEKTEALYQAVLQSADETQATLPGYDLAKMGRGVLRAKALLDRAFDPAAKLTRRSPSKIDPSWLARELLTMIGIKRFGLAEMIGAEIKQIVYRNDSVRGTVKKLDLTQDADRRRLASELIDSQEASEHLQKWLVQYRDRP